MAPSLYIHVPFCRRKCVYCNFYSAIYDDKAAAGYVDAVLAQLEKIDSRVYSLYIGGGTPTALDIKLLKRLMPGLSKFSIESGEFTVEANPESLDSDKMELLLDSGANRLSIGVQSLDDRKLKRLGRIHSAGRAVEAIHSARKLGFKNIGADLIFGVWDETLDGWREEIRKAALLPVEHISCYELTYEKGTPLFGALQNKSVRPLEDTLTAAMYESAVELLGTGGFHRYEVSNFAKTGFESRHNSHYWQNDSYVGLGPSAVSYIDGTRTRNISDVRDYIDAVRAGKPAVEFSERLNPLERAKETAAVKIRTEDGIDFDWFRAKTGYDLLDLEKKAVEELLDKDLIKYKKKGGETTGIVLKLKGYLFCDTVSSELL